jgi:hypothetical protein
MWGYPLASAAVLVVGLAGLPKAKAQIAADQQLEEQLRKPIGLALRDIVRPGERLMLEPIGYIGYFSEARVLDAVGLVSPEAIPYYREGAVSPYLDMMNDLRPEWVLLRAGEYDDAIHARVAPEKSLESHYRLSQTFSDPASPPGSTPAFFLFRRIPERAGEPSARFPAQTSVGLRVFPRSCICVFAEPGAAV